MQGRRASAVLLVLLIGVSFALGGVLNQAGGWLGPGEGGSGGQSTGGSGSPPHGLTRLVVLAEQDTGLGAWNLSALDRTPPDPFFSPVVGLSLSLTLQGTRVRPALLSTNSSGLATFLVTNGSYALQASTPTFKFNVLVNVTKGATTNVAVKIFPSFSPIDTYVLTGEDAGSKPVPSSVMYAQVTSVLPSGPPLTFPPGQFVQLVESLNQTQVTSKNQFVNVLLPGSGYTLNGTVLGSYHGERGDWIVLGLAPPPSALLPQKLLIMTYSVATTVSQGAV